MSRRFEKEDWPALERCRNLGLNPIPFPNGDAHHTDAPASESDRAIGDALAYFLGTLFADVDGEHSKYWYHERTSIDEWTRVARALRIHGLKIVTDDAPADAGQLTEFSSGPCPHGWAPSSCDQCKAAAAERRCPKCGFQVGHHIGCPNEERGVERNGPYG